MQRKSVGFLAALGMVSLLAMSACSKSDQTPPADPRVPRYLWRYHRWCVARPPLARNTLCRTADHATAGHLCGCLHRLQQLRRHCDIKAPGALPCSNMKGGLSPLTTVTTAHPKACCVALSTPMAPPCRGPLRFGGHAEPGRLSRNQGWRQITCFFVVNDVGHGSLGPGVQPLEQVRWRRCAGPAAPPHRAARPQSGRIARRVAGGRRRGKTSRQVRRSTTARPPARTATSDHPVRAIHTAPAQRAPRRLRRHTATIDAPATPRATAAQCRGS